MENIINVLKNSPVIFAATVDDKNRPNNRPIALAMEDNGILFFTSRRQPTLWTGDRSSDVCSSDLRDCNPQPREGGWRA